TMKPGLEALRGKGWDLALCSKARGVFERLADSRCVEQKICPARRDHRQRRPPHYQAHAVGGARPQPAFVVMGEEFGLVSRHVDRDRTIVLAALALEAEIERLAYALLAPAFVERVAAHHLE